VDNTTTFATTGALCIESGSRNYADYRFRTMLDVR
jgi:hypothetical protein